MQYGVFDGFKKKIGDFFKTTRIAIGDAVKKVDDTVGFGRRIALFNLIDDKIAETNKPVLHFGCGTEPLGTVNVDFVYREDVTGFVKINPDEPHLDYGDKHFGLGIAVNSIQKLKLWQEWSAELVRVCDTLIVACPMGPAAMLPDNFWIFDGKHNVTKNPYYLGNKYGLPISDFYNKITQAVARVSRDVSKFMKKE